MSDGAFLSAARQATVLSLVKSVSASGSGSLQPRVSVSLQLKDHAQGISIVVCVTCSREVQVAVSLPDDLGAPNFAPLHFKSSKSQK